MELKTLYLCILLSLTCEVRCDEGNRTVRFEDVAPVNYDYLTLPKINGQSVKVNLSINNMIIRSVDESDMSFTVAIELWQIWTDLRLIFPSWSKKEFQILDSKWLNKLWVPNLYFVNSVDGKMNNIITPSSFFWLATDRRIFYCCRVILKLICEMDLHRFPHDVQTCGIKMASAIFKEEDLTLQWSPIINKTSEYSTLQQFQIIHTEKRKCLAKLSNHNSSCLQETVVLKRRVGYYFINVYIPTILIVIMSMLTFWIPPEAVPARITLGVTSLLTIITKQYQASLPNVSYIVALNVWLSSCIAFVFFSLLEFAAVIAIGTRSEEKKLFKSDQPDLDSPLIILRPNGTWSATKSRLQRKEKKTNIGQKRVDFFSKIFFPSAFLIFCIVYWQYYGLS